MKHFAAGLLGILVLLVGLWHSSEAFLMKKMMKDALVMGSMMRSDMPPWPMMPLGCCGTYHMELDVHPPMATSAEWQQMPLLGMKPHFAKHEDLMSIMKMMAQMKNDAQMAHDAADQKMHMDMQAMNSKPTPTPGTVKPPCHKDSPMSIPMQMTTVVPNGVSMMARPEV
ncbi:hypothetical protein BIW11_02660, partial [Tropilaelaps mercedesae]